MENLEEVLQALDEFQKMRPTEIPRELEEYLCWVAKTGDPVYQWSLIKTLFREKLTRVMTDFYESCPSLELGPCPNVEHFNYDTMKSNLLERLESFANAPFTVQRICELLTAPRKEYNRVDKFMRAIEKNILVVSTREPGPIARRSENGDSMVNGSVDEESSITQPPQDIEMEYWEKDCASTVTISVHTVENETPLLHTVIPTTVVKNVFGSDDNTQEKLEQTSTKSEVQSEESAAIPGTQNINPIVSDTSGIVGEVPEAIINEDTTSQPSLDLENEECEDNVKPTEKVDIGSKIIGPNEGNKSSLKENGESIESTVESKTDAESREPLNPVVENLLKTSDEKMEENVKTDAMVENKDAVLEGSSIDRVLKTVPVFESNSLDTACSVNSTDAQTGLIKSYVLDKGSSENSDSCTNSLSFASGETTSRISYSGADPKDKTTSEHLKHKTEEIELSGDTPKPIIEEPPSKDADTDESNKTCSSKPNNLAIVETTDDETEVVKSLVPDPIPIVEEPKEGETGNSKSDTASVLKSMESIKNETNTLNTQSVINEKPVEVRSLDDLQSNDVVTATRLQGNESAIIEHAASKERCESVELMDVDDEESLSMFQHDEPMEQETAELSKS